MTMQEKAGAMAGLIWTTLDGTEGMPGKQLKKAIKVTDKDLYLGLGWLLRENKVETEEIEKDIFVKLK